MFYASGPTANCAAKRLSATTNRSSFSIWFKEWKINPSKTTAVRYANKILFHAKNIQMKGNTIKRSSKAECFGVTIDSELHFTSRIANIVNKIEAAKHCSLFPVINKRSPIPLKMKLHVFETYLRPILTYAGPALGVRNLAKHVEKIVEHTISISLQTANGL